MRNDFFKFAVIVVILLVSFAGCLIVIVVGLNMESDPTSAAILYEGRSERFSHAVVKGMTEILVEATSGEDAEMAIEPYDYGVSYTAPSHRRTPPAAKRDEAESDKSDGTAPTLPTLKTMDTVETAKTN